jgi:Uma2 family endonuclease
MGIPKTANYITPEEYYRLERAAEYKSEYFDGEIFPMNRHTVHGMAGGTSRHSLITVQLTMELGNALKKSPGGCRPYSSDQRVKVAATGLRSYPDLSVFCGKLEYDEDDDQKETATNPAALFEVLSDSTEAYDRGAKAENYRKIASLKAYALISQNAAHIELFERQADGSWLMTEATGMNASLRIPSLGIELSLGEIYDGVEFPAEPLRVVKA